MNVVLGVIFKLLPPNERGWQSCCPFRASSHRYMPLLPAHHNIIPNVTQRGKLKGKDVRANEKQVRSAPFCWWICFAFVLAVFIPVRLGRVACRRRWLHPGPLLRSSTAAYAKAVLLRSLLRSHTDKVTLAGRSSLTAICSSDASH